MALALALALAMAKIKMNIRRIMRVTLIGSIIFWSLNVSAQATLLPNWVIDSLLYEAKLSRQCNQALVSLQAENKALGNELIHVGKALGLSQAESKALENLLQNSKQSKEIISMQYTQDRKELKRKIRKRNTVILGETLTLVVLILLL